MMLIRTPAPCRPLVLVSAILLCLSLDAVTSAMADGVDEAYELRLAGQADEAKTMLELMVERDSQDHEAYYELSRTELHMGLGNPADIGDSIVNANEHIAKAVELDSQNVDYLYLAGQAGFIRAYMAMQQGGEQVREHVATFSGYYESLLELRPDDLAAALYLVEIHTVVPADMGGNRSRAETLARSLRDQDAVMGAKAEALLMPDDADYVAFWQGVLADHPDDADVFHELGRAYLFGQDAEKGRECFEQAARLAPDKRLLWMDYARFHIMRSWGDQAGADEHLKAAKEPIHVLLENDLPGPLRAYALGMLSRVKAQLQDTEGAETAYQEAERLDPHFSKASGIPTEELFRALGEEKRSHRYLFMPF